MKSTFTLSILGGLVPLAATQGGWWFNSNMDCAKPCRSSFYGKNDGPTAWCDATSAASCLSSACATASPSDYSEFASATSAICSVHDSCSSGATQTITATRSDRTATAVVTGCPNNGDGPGWWGGGGSGNWWGGSGWGGDSSGWGGDWGCDGDRDGWSCKTDRKTAMVTVTAADATRTQVQTQTVLQAVSGSVTQGTTLAVAVAAAPTETHKGAAAGIGNRAGGVALGVFVAAVVMM